MDLTSPLPAATVNTNPLTVSSSPQPSHPVAVNTQNHQTQPVIYAGFGRRFLAGLVDGIIMIIINFTITIPVSFLSGGNSTNVMRSIFALALPILQWLINISYFVYFIGSRGQTPGKMVMGIKVIKIDTHLPPGYINAFLREVIGKIISSLVICLGFFWMLWDKNKQTWHDKIANTIVVKI